MACLKFLIVAALAGDPLFQFEGTTADERFGHGVAGGADVDHDGVPDLLISAPGQPEDGSGAGGTAGRVRVVSGGNGALIYEFVAGTPGGEFGFATSFVGDVDDDGFTEIAVGEPLWDDGTNIDAGAVYVFSGQTGALRYTVSGDEAGDRFGSSVYPGDVDGGGVLTSFLVGSPGSDLGGVDSGKVSLIWGFNGLEFDELFVPNTPGFLVGTALGLTQPIAPGPGTPDALIGAPGGDSVLVVQLTNSLLLNATLTGTPQPGGTRFGAAVAGDFDYDLNGESFEIAVGAPGEDLDGVDRGRVYIFDRSTLGLIGTLPGLNAGDRFGSSIAVVRGGSPDALLVGSAGSSSASLYGPGADLRQVFLGPPGFASSVASVGDISGDGLMDVLIGSPQQANGNGIASGVAFAFHPTNLASGDVIPAGLGCSGIATPTLDLVGCTSPGKLVFLAIDDGPPGATAVLLLGASIGNTPLYPGCALAIANLVPATLNIPLDGGGRALAPIQVPPAASGITVNLQAPVVHPSGVTVTNAIQVSFQ